MQPNAPFTPPTQQPPAYVPVVAAVPVKEKNETLPKVLVGVLIVVIAVGGIGAYIWRDATAIRQKNDDAAKITQLESKNTELTAKINAMNDTQGSQELTIQYSSILARSNTVKAQTAAQSVQKVAEALNQDIGYYPRTTADFSGTEVAKIPAGISVSATPVSSNNGTTTVHWEYTGNASAPDGGRVTFWDYTAGAVSANILYVGIATVNSIFISPKS